MGPWTSWILQEFSVSFHLCSPVLGDFTIHIVRCLRYSEKAAWPPSWGRSPFQSCLFVRFWATYSIATIFKSLCSDHLHVWICQQPVLMPASQTVFSVPALRRYKQEDRAVYHEFVPLCLWTQTSTVTSEAYKGIYSLTQEVFGLNAACPTCPIWLLASSSSKWNSVLAFWRNVSTWSHSMLAVAVLWDKIYRNLQGETKHIRKLEMCIWCSVEHKKCWPNICYVRDAAIEERMILTGGNHKHLIDIWLMLCLYKPLINLNSYSRWAVWVKKKGKICKWEQWGDGRFSLTDDDGCDLVLTKKEQM